MAAAEQLAALDDLHRRLDAAGIEYWLFGGWAVDFHAGAVTRAHGDLDLAVWARDLSRITALLHAGGWAQEPDGAPEGATAFARGGVTVELAFLARDEPGGEPYTPLPGGGRAAWAAGAFGPDVRTLTGVRARVVALAALREEKTGPRADPVAAAKDRADRAILARLR